MNHYRVTGWVEGPGGTVPFRRVFMANDVHEAIDAATDLAQELWDGELTVDRATMVSHAEAEQERKAR